MQKAKLGGKSVAPQTGAGNVAKGAVRTYGSGSFKKREWTIKGGVTKTAWKGYVYASNGRQCYGTGKTNKAAEQAAIAARDEYERRLQEAPVPAPSAEVPTLEAWLTTYNDHRRRQRRSTATVKKYRDYRLKWVALDPDGKGPLGARPLPDITFDVLELCIAELGREYAVNTLRNLQAYIAGALKRAHLMRHIERPEGALLSPIKRKTRRELDFNPDDLAALLRAARGDHAMTAALVLGSYGLRIGEACGVTDEDLRGNVLTLSRQLDRVEEMGEHGPQGADRPRGARPCKEGGSCLSLTKLKSDAASRKIVLDDHAAKLLMAALDGAKLDTLWDSVDRKWVRRLFVVHAPGGRAQETQRLRDRFVALCKEAGVEGATFHLQRALFATSEAAEGTPLKVLSAALGHTSVAITETYVRSLLGTDSAVWSGAGRRLQALMA